MRRFEYTPINVCSKKMIIEVDGETIVNVEIIGGCDGNRKAVASLVTGLTLEEVIKKLKGITCGKKTTSCADQLATACEMILKEIRQ